MENRADSGGVVQGLGRSSLYLHLLIACPGRAQGEEEILAGHLRPVCCTTGSLEKTFREQIQLYLQHLPIWCNYPCRGQFQAIHVKSQTVGMGGDGHSSPPRSVYTVSTSQTHEMESASGTGSQRSWGNLEVMSWRIYSLSFKNNF